MKMWDGRFSKALNDKANDFNSSISVDCRMFREDIEGSKAHAEMLGRCGIISTEESEMIIEALQKIKNDLEDGSLVIDPEAEDIHMFVEKILTERIGDVGKKLHTGRSRNDQVALDSRIYCKKQIREIQDLIAGLLEVISSLAKNHSETIMPGYTHLQRAQPVSFSHYILAYAQMFLRDYGRLDDAYRRTDCMPLGSGALAGTTYALDRFMVSDKLGFASVTSNSIDGVSDRDFILELSSALSILMMHLSRYSEDLILWCSSEFSFIELDDAYSTGSSIMPQKKNPDMAELVRGKTARVYGDMVTLFTMMKSLPLAYNKDMQEDKSAVFDSIDNTKCCIEIITELMATLTVKSDKMRSAASGGFINATDCADYLVKKGMPFRDAYKITGKLVAYCIDNSKTFETLTLDEYRMYSDLFTEDVYEAVDLVNCLQNRKIYGGPSKESVIKQIEALDCFLASRNAE